jgi:5-methylthioadenosine/S-adenosylhomocysteine deaminase
MNNLSILADAIYFSNELHNTKYLNIKDNIIDSISDKPKFNNVLQRSNCAIFPSFKNTHTHLPMVYFRGMADDLPLMDWLKNHIWPAESKWLSEEFVYDATLLAATEMIRNGTTFANDMYFFSDKIADAIIKAGLKSTIGVGVLDFPTKFAKTPEEYLEKTAYFVDKFKENDLIDIAICPHAIYTVSPENYKKCVKFAEKYNISIHTHLAESEWEIQESIKLHGKTPVEIMHDTGMLDTKSIFAHCVHLSDEEIKLLGNKNTNISICIESNGKLANGFSPVKKLLDAGANLTVGTDGAASNNDLDMLAEMSTIAKIHKGISKDATALNSLTTLKMATDNVVNSKIHNNLGTLDINQPADFIILSYEKPHMRPVYNHLSHLIYSAKSSDVRDTFVNGKPLMLDYKLTTLDEDMILEKADFWKNKILNK